MNKIIILLLLLVILSFIYLNFNSFKERFESNTKVFEISNVRKGSEIIRGVNTFNRYNKLDKRLRDISSKTNIYHHYISNLCEWTDHEKVLLNWLKHNLLKKMHDKYKFLFNNVYIVKYNDDIEMGFPHTHSDTIFLTGKFVKTIIKYYNKNNINDCISDVGSIMIHEAVHIWQRREKEFFKGLYKKWNFTKYKKIYNFANLRKKNRYNPDGVELLWGWKSPRSDQEIIPMAVYMKGATDISHVNLIGVRLEKLGNIPVIPPIMDFNNLNEINEYRDFFGNLGGNNYHPNELSAEIISRVITNEILETQNTQNYKAAEIFKEEFEARN